MAELKALSEILPAYVLLLLSPSARVLFSLPHQPPTRIGSLLVVGVEERIRLVGYHPHWPNNTQQMPRPRHKRAPTTPCSYLTPKQDDFNQELRACLAEALYDVGSIVTDPGAYTKELATLHSQIGSNLEQAWKTAGGSEDQLLWDSRFC